MTKRPVLHCWETGTMFGAPVIRGQIDGENRTATLLWVSHGRFGLSWNGRSTDLVVVPGSLSPQEVPKWIA